MTKVSAQALGGVFTPEHFDDHFEAKEVDSPELFEQVAKLRHQVYCIERQFERSAFGGPLRESDEYDTAAIHAALTHIETQRVIGCFRLIRPDQDGAGRTIPLLDQYGEAIDIDLSGVPIDTSAEISRFAISKHFRQGRGQRLIGGEKPAAAASAELKILPHLTIALLRAVYALSKRYGITHLVALIDRSLMRQLRRFGIRMEAIGPSVNHKGIRVPAVMSVAENAHLVEVNRPEIWNVIRTELHKINPGLAARGAFA